MFFVQPKTAQAWEQGYTRVTTTVTIIGTLLPSLLLLNQCDYTTITATGGIDDAWMV